MDKSKSNKYSEEAGELSERISSVQATFYLLSGELYSLSKSGSNDAIGYNYKISYQYICGYCEDVLLELDKLSSRASELEMELFEPSEIGDKHD
ncbi:hypothetical protein [Loigolactobacillus backii]|uniref:hypothetical protein n=1 Tax=Loigolactobacillus backii TaxID=375175 RepID=UPI000C1CA90F|nr:hypothetical protein [Loigolactobacillus backii]MDA5388580.1 hypothetical protein [Loigolactobacillus backii]MDA5391034.1 hypothetical protein [Loigolactobacillus backii]PIO83801.1 hypothetical protein BSQ39_09590 [Loigolactobacillus backii]